MGYRLSINLTYFQVWNGVNRDKGKFASRPQIDFYEFLQVCHTHLLAIDLENFRVDAS